MDSTAAGPGDPDQDDEATVEATLAPKNCDGANKSDDGNRKLRAMFGRRRTHNEQIISRPCGVILSRVEMYGAEALNSVIVSLHHFLLMLC